MKIEEIKAGVIKNSRGEDAIEILVNKKYKGSTASGASNGKHEVPCFSPKGISFSVDFVNKNSHFKNFYLEEFSDLAVFDPFIPIIGGNSVVALQLACLKAMADNKVYSFLDSITKKMPIPLGNCIGGGAHSSAGTYIQEFLLIPEKKTVAERIALNREIYNAIGCISKAKKKTDEGAFVLPKPDQEVFSFLDDVLEGFRNNGHKINFGLDIASSQLYNKGKYNYKNFASSQKRRILTREEQVEQVNAWIKAFGLTYVEDPLQEEDFNGFSKISKKTLVCGDDLVTTNIERLKIALKENSVNCVIVKPNQIGSLVKTKEFVDFCHKKGIVTVLSHRSGETMDNSLSHLAVGWKIPYIKIGIFGKERECKLQELIRIEQEIS